MTFTIASPALFRASALAAAADGPWATPGFHLRVQVSPLIGFPLHPFAAWRIDAGWEIVDLQLRWRDAENNALSIPFDLEKVGGYAEGFLFGVPASDPCVWLEADVTDRGLLLELLGGGQTGDGPQVVAARSAHPYRFGHTGVLGLRASGAGTISTVRGIFRPSVVPDEVFEREPDLTFGLPLGPGPWWDDPWQGDPMGAAKERVRLGAPVRLAPPDNPGGALPNDTDPDMETRRIIESIAPEYIAPWLERGWGNRSIAPVHASFVHEEGTTPAGKPVKAVAPVTGSLLTMAVDPQIARYLGLATVIPYQDTGPVAPANIWIIAGGWVVQPDLIVGRPVIPHRPPLTLGQLLGNDMDTLDRFSPNMQGSMKNVPTRYLFAVAVAAGEAPPDPPSPLDLAAFQPGGWNPDGTWRQVISLGARPARGMIGFARTAPDGPVCLHRLAPEPGKGLPSRALPLVPGVVSGNAKILEDDAVPAVPAGASWRVWNADEFGQWSGPATLTLPLPTRPAPPPPVLEVTFRALPDDGSSGSRVPGGVELRCIVPGPSGIVPGGLPIAELQVSVDGLPVPPRKVVPGETVVLAAAPRAFAVGEQRPVPVIAFYKDMAGTPSDTSHTDCHVFDARPPRALHTAQALVWTGPSDSTGKAELALRWPPAPGAARYRIYLGDARRLAGALQLQKTDINTHVRAKQAQPIYEAREWLTGKGHFTFLGETDGTVNDGFVTFTTRIPGGLRNVQFVRIVPATQGGAEAAFHTCGLVPVAVPSTERPPPPLLDATTDPVTGLTLTIRAHGLRAEVLAASPGSPPQYRVRRCRPGTDPQYAGIHAEGQLAPGPDGSWIASVPVPAADLHPFARSCWYAEIRYPDEPALPDGVSALPPDGGVEPVWGEPGTPCKRLWSAPSLAAESLLIPPEPPAAPTTPTRTENTDGSVTLTFTTMPTTHQAADPYLLEIYRATPDETGRRAVLTVLTPELAWTDPAPAPPAARYDVMLVDPLGRRGQAAHV
ncbi:hypothetical protein GCM10022221_39420 [Actinocorallia aurea]